jgi:hypothetical protein
MTVRSSRRLGRDGGRGVCWIGTRGAARAGRARRRALRPLEHTRHRPDRQAAAHPARYAGRAAAAGGTDSDVYTRLVADAGRQDLHRYYVIEDGNHVDGLYNAFPDRLRPILPCYRDAFAALESWVDDGVPPPPSHLVSRPATGDVVNTCSVR